MQFANVNAKEIKLEAIVIRADGTRENLGVIDYWHQNPLKRFVWKLKKLLERN
jgi:hypothetical protein